MMTVSLKIAGTLTVSDPSPLLLPITVLPVAVRGPVTVTALLTATGPLNMLVASMITVWLLLVPSAVLPLTFREVADTAAALIGALAVTAQFMVNGALIVIAELQLLLIPPRVTGPEADNAPVIDTVLAAVTGALRAVAAWIVTVWLLVAPRTVFPRTVSVVAVSAAAVIGAVAVTAAVRVVGELIVTIWLLLLGLPRVTLPAATRSPAYK